MANLNPFTAAVRTLSCDEILGGQLKIAQPETGYRVAIDPIFLAAAVPLQNGMKILDVGCGVGTAGLCVLARAKKNMIAGVQLTGIDCEKIFISLAQENAQLNQFTGAQFILGDIANPVAELNSGSFDVVMTNPPYLSAHSADPSPDRLKAIANVESTVDLSNWIKFCASMVSDKGKLIMIHRADRLAEICHYLQIHKLFSTEISPIYPKEGEDASRVLIQAWNSKKNHTKLMPGLILHEKSGSYFPAAQKILLGQ